MGCGSSGWGFESPYLPLFRLLRAHTALSTQLRSNMSYLFVISHRIQTLHIYFSRNALVWNEGLFVDFLQKKIVDRWVRTFISVSANMFSDKVVFELIYRFYIVLILENVLKFNTVDHNNIASLFNSFVFLFSLLMMFLLTWNVFIIWANLRCFCPFWSF